ncbi:MAG: 3-oxoacyl-ACP reductase FabG [Actinomycetaceae bacterium]
MTGTSGNGPRSVLVTGASQGIGEAVAKRFLGLGDQVAVLSRSGRGPEGTLALAGDVASTEDVDAAFAAAEEAHGPVEIVVANAGVTRDQLLMRMSDEDFDTVVQTNLGGAFKVARRAAKGMIRLRRGRIVLVSSVIGLYGGPGQVNYAAAKAGLVGMARSITRELGKRSVTANVVAPGFIDTEMTRVLPEAQQQTYLGAIPAGRFGDIEDVAGVVEFLASPAAGYISGAVIPVDGGLGMGH